MKVQVCDRCGAEERAEAVTVLPAGWGRLVHQGAGTLELCPVCVQAVMEHA